MDQRGNPQELEEEEEEEEEKSGGEIFCTLQTGPGAHLSSYTKGTGGKRPGRGVNHPPPSSAEIKERVELYLYSPSVPSW